jgi:hypothetical protein
MTRLLASPLPPYRSGFSYDASFPMSPALQRWKWVLADRGKWLWPHLFLPIPLPLIRGCPSILCLSGVIAGDNSGSNKDGFCILFLLYLHCVHFLYFESILILYCQVVTKLWGLSTHYVILSTMTVISPSQSCQPDELC